MSLLLPKHVAANLRADAARRADAAPASAQPRKHAINSDDFLDPRHVADQMHIFTQYKGAVPQPVGWRISVLVLTIPETTSGGLIMVDDYLEARSLASPQGVVIALGDAAYKDPQRFPEKTPWVKPGDRIMFQKYAGRMFQLRTGQHVAILNDTDPAGVVDGGWLDGEADE